MVIFRKGKIFQNPETLEAYMVAKDVISGEAVMASDFVGLNGTPDPKTGDVIPEWLSYMMWPRW